MQIRQFRSFSIELMKFASGLPDDAGMRAALAESHGDEDYLPGGELSSNGTASELLQKLSFSSIAATQVGSSAMPLNKNVNVKGSDSYQDKRDWAITGLKGATGGVGATGLAHSLRNAEHKLTTKQVRHGAAIGASLALGDRLLRHHAAKKHEHVKQAFVQPSLQRKSESPGSVLRAEQETGSIHAGTPKMIGNAPHPVRLGTHKFQMPKV